ncbi:hypothetical protein CHH83_05770 [Bacillus sp. 7586-K]|nr:hypothetical protein CHH83_05770 [Bacillus sp. 7586-K]
MGKKNHHIEKVKKEEYNNGYKQGYEHGKVAGIKMSTRTIGAKFNGLDKVPGIGPKLIEKISTHFGKEYFQEVPDEYKEAVRNAEGS